MCIIRMMESAMQQHQAKSPGVFVGSAHHYRHSDNNSSSTPQQQVWERQEAEEEQGGEGDVARRTEEPPVTVFWVSPEQLDRLGCMLRADTAPTLLSCLPV